jgi:hypothetical protein
MSSSWMMDIGKFVADDGIPHDSWFTVVNFKIDANQYSQAKLNMHLTIWSVLSIILIKTQTKRLSNGTIYLTKSVNISRDMIIQKYEVCVPSRTVLLLLSNQVENHDRSYIWQLTYTQSELEIDVIHSRHNSA